MHTCWENTVQASKSILDGTIDVSVWCWSTTKDSQKKSGITIRIDSIPELLTMITSGKIRKIVIDVAILMAAHCFTDHVHVVVPLITPLSSDTDNTSRTISWDRCKVASLWNSKLTPRHRDHCFYSSFYLLGRILLQVSKGRFVICIPWQKGVREVFHGQEKPLGIRFQ